MASDQSFYHQGIITLSCMNCPGVSSMIGSDISHFGDSQAESLALFQTCPIWSILTLITSITHIYMHTTLTTMYYIISHLYCSHQHVYCNNVWKELQCDHFKNILEHYKSHIQIFWVHWYRTGGLSIKISSLFIWKHVIIWNGNSSEDFEVRLW